MAAVVRPSIAIGLMLLGMLSSDIAAGGVIDAGRLGSLPLELPESEVRQVVFLFSDLTGWDADMDEAAARLSGAGAAVLEVDLPTYLARLEESSDRDCHYLISEVERASKLVQRELGLRRYLSPILAGTGMGSALAYGALAQAPAATVAGAASDGLETELATRLPLCPGAPSTRAASGFDYGPKADLPGWWRIAVPPQQKAAAEQFVAGIAQAELVEVPDGAGLDARLAAALPSPLATPADDASVGDLPLVELPASGPGDLMAVFYSGDGGWRDLDKQISGVLAAHDIPTVGVDSLRYFWEEETPQQVADDLADILGHYRAAWGRQQVILLGYSFGAGILPFAINRLPSSEKARIRQISLLGLVKFALFEFHVTEWLGVGGDTDARAVLPEIAKLDPALVQCFHGAEEEDTACTASEFDRAERIETGGGHHFDGDYAALAEKIMAGARRRAKSG
jgi:type IV secretory pathway VirJ component